MKISKKTDYALRALVTMAEGGNELLSIQRIAQVNDIPKRFLEHIMLDLKNLGVVKGIPGRLGGYELAQPPQDIKIGSIIRYFDKMLAPLPCVSVKEYEHCSQETTCRFRRLFLQIRNHTAKLLDSCTLQMLLEFQPVTELEVSKETELLIEGAGI